MIEQRKTCSYAKRYKGLRPPKCGCSECEKIFQKITFDSLNLKVGDFCFIEAPSRFACLELAQVTEEGVLHLPSNEVLPFSSVKIVKERVGRNPWHLANPTENAMTEKHREGCKCHDCSKQTFFTDLYMVTGAIWNEFGVKKDVLCIACLEARMGRELERKDFIKCPLNTIMYQPWCAGTLLEQRLRPNADMKGLAEIDW